MKPGEKLPPPRTDPVVTAAVGAVLALSMLLLGNLAVLREFSPTVPASLMAAVLLLAVPGGALVGLGLGAYRVASVRLLAGRGREAGSALKVAVVLVLCLGLLATVIVLQLSYGVLGGFLPASATGSLFLYRASVALPAVGCSAVLAGGLLAVDRPRSVWPGLAVASVGAVVAAHLWVGRGAGLAGYELAGAGLSMPVAVLLGTMTFGALLLAVRDGRERLSIHLARPFALGDVASVLRCGWRPGVALALTAAATFAWMLLTYRDASALSVAPATATFLFTGLALSSVLLGAMSAGSASLVLLAVVLVALVLPGLGLVVAPRFTLSPFTSHAETLTGVRLVGLILLQEAALCLAIRRGWLDLRRSPVVELVLLAGLSFGGGLVVMGLGADEWTALTMAVLISRGLTVPLLRR